MTLNKSITGHIWLRKLRAAASRSKQKAGIKPARFRRPASGSDGRAFLDPGVGCERERLVGVVPRELGLVAAEWAVGGSAAYSSGAHIGKVVLTVAA